MHIKWVKLLGDSGDAVRLRRHGAQLALTRSDRTGGFRFPGLAADAYEVSVGDTSPVVVPVRLAEGATVTVTVRYAVSRPSPSRAMCSWACSLRRKMILTESARPNKR